MIRTLDIHNLNLENKDTVIYAMNDLDQVACLAIKYEIAIPNHKSQFIYFKDEMNTNSNGLTVEILISICLDRLYCLQESQYESVDNELAIVNLENTLHWLGSRTDSRNSYKHYNSEKTK